MDEIEGREKNMKKTYTAPCVEVYSMAVAQMLEQSREKVTVGGETDHADAKVRTVTSGLSNPSRKLWEEW